MREDIRRTHRRHELESRGVQETRGLWKGDALRAEQPRSSLASLHAGAIPPRKIGEIIKLYSQSMISFILLSTYCLCLCCLGIEVMKDT